MRFAAIVTTPVLCASALPTAGAAEMVFDIIVEHELAKEHKRREDRAAKKHGVAHGLYHAGRWLAANREAFVTRLRRRHAPSFPRWASAVARAGSVRWVATMEVAAAESALR